MAATINSGNTGIDVRKMVGQFTNLVAHEGAVGQGTYTHQLHQPAGEIEHLQRGGVFDQAQDVVGNNLFGADDDIDRYRFLGENFRMRKKLGGPDASDLGRRMKQGIGNLAGDHVDLVAVAHGQYQVSVFRACAPQRVRVRAIAMHGAQVQTVLQLLQTATVQIDHGDVVGLVDEIFGHRGSDLTGTEDDDLHGALE